MCKLRFINLLLKQGDIDPIILDKQGPTLVLTHAVKARCKGMVEMLRGRGYVGSDPLNSDGETPKLYHILLFLCRGGKVF